MSSWRDVSIRTKLVIVFAAVFLATFGLGVTSLWTSSVIFGDADSHARTH